MLCYVKVTNDIICISSAKQPNISSIKPLRHAKRMRQETLPSKKRDKLKRKLREKRRATDESPLGTHVKFAVAASLTESSE